MNKYTIFLCVIGIAAICQLDIAVVVKADSTSRDNRFDYANPYCLGRLKTEIQEAVSSFVSDFISKHLVEISSAVGERAGRRARNEVQQATESNSLNEAGDERLPLNSAIGRAIRRSLTASFEPLGDESIPITRGVLQKLCVEENCCYA